jgi:hypothetical protein
MKTLTRPMSLRDIPSPDRVRAMLAQMGVTVRPSNITPLHPERHEKGKYQSWRRQGLTVEQMAQRAKVTEARIRKVLGEQE